MICNDNIQNNILKVVISSKFSIESQLYEIRRCFINFHLLLELCINNNDWVLIKNNGIKTLCQLVYDETLSVKENEVHMNSILSDLLNNPNSIEIEKINSFNTLEVNPLTTMTKLDEVVLEVNKHHATKETINKIKDIFDSITINRKYISLNQLVALGTNSSAIIKISQLKHENNILNLDQYSYYGNTYFIEGSNNKVKIKVVNNKEVSTKLNQSSLFHDILIKNQSYCQFINNKYKKVAVISEDIGLLSKSDRIEFI